MEMTLNTWLTQLRRLKKCGKAQVPEGATQPWTSRSTWMVLEIHHTACFPALLVLVPAANLDQVCSVDQKVETYESVHLQRGGREKLVDFE